MGSVCKGSSDLIMNSDMIQSRLLDLLESLVSSLLTEKSGLMRGSDGASTRRDSGDSWLSKNLRLLSS